MLSLACRSGRRLRRQLTALHRQLATDPGKTDDTEHESPAQRDRRLMEEEELSANQNYYSAYELLRPEKSSTVEYFQRFNSITFSREATIKFLNDKIKENRVLQQRFLEERHRTLGFDLAAAHFIVARGGRVRFQGEKRWITRLENGRVPLPGRFTYGMYLEELDASGTEIIYEGLENFIKLSRLRALYLRDCPFVDDWCVDRVCGEFRHTLHHLDISGCPRVTETGIEGVAQLKELKSLTLERMEHIKLLPYICLLLEDAIPGLEIRGVDVLQPPPDSLSELTAQDGTQSEAPTPAASSDSSQSASSGSGLPSSGSDRVHPSTA